ncbi:MAG: hypothetical protein ACRYG6_06565 [Janthinobacterium lividum]
MPDAPPRNAIDERPLKRLLAAMPAFAQRWFAWLRRPDAKWVRLPVGVLMILGGFAGFLPILGFWMIPVGLFLLGEDIPAVKRLTMRALAAVQGWWDRRRGRA